MDADRATRQLRLIAEIVALSADTGIELWLRGGWALDFFLGEPTREHRDIDWFGWAADAPRVQVEIKKMMPIWVPGRPVRPKDAEDIARLEAALR
jgi:hypothetical protein